MSEPAEVPECLTSELWEQFNIPKPTCMAPLVEYLRDHHPEIIENALHEMRRQTDSAMHDATIVNTDAMQQLTGNQDLPPEQQLNSVHDLSPEQEQSPELPYHVEFRLRPMEELLCGPSQHLNLESRREIEKNAQLPSNSRKKILIRSTTKQFRKRNASPSSSEGTHSIKHFKKQQRCNHVDFPPTLDPILSFAEFSEN